MTERKIPRRRERFKVLRDGKWEDVISPYTRRHAWAVLYQTPRHLIKFRELFPEIRSRIQKQFPYFIDKKAYRQDVCLVAFMVHGSNIAIFSQNGELWVTYAHLIHKLIEYVEFYGPQIGRGKSREMRASARLLLTYIEETSVSELRSLVRTKGYELDIRSFMVLRGDFALIPKEDRIEVTFSTRIAFKAA